MKELIFKIILTFVFVGVLGGGLFLSVRWIWSKQLDFSASVKKLGEKANPVPDWVATRDPKKIYQGGKAVGDVRGEPTSANGYLVFLELVNTSGFDSSQPFEYKRYKLKLTKADSFSGMKVSMTNKGSETLTGVYENATCNILSQ